MTQMRHKEGETEEKEKEIGMEIGMEMGMGMGRVGEEEVELEV